MFLNIGKPREKEQFLSEGCGGSEKSLLLWVYKPQVQDLLGLGVLGDGLGALRHGVLGQLTRKQQPDGGLDFPGGDGAAPVVVGQSGGLGGDALKDVDESGDGLLTRDEVKLFLKEQYLLKFRDFYTNQIRGELEEVVVDTLLDMVDANGDGQINYEEFSATVMAGAN